MQKREDFIVEIHTEELPPKALLKLANAFLEQIKDRLTKADLSFEAIHYFATPRRLAVFVKNLVSAQPDQIVERKGPALNAAFDAEGKPSKACEGFAKSVGVAPKDLMTIKTDQGEWVGYRQEVPGKAVGALLPEMVEQSLHALPIPKRMRWGDNDAQFVRPVHSIIMLYGDEIIPATILGCKAGRVTRGHRYYGVDLITIPHASTYESLLETEGRVIADFAKRREKIKVEAESLVKKSLGDKAHIAMDEALLDEVTGLVEWPVALLGQFDAKFLKVPSEVLISSMQDHQRYFPIFANQDDTELLPNFITISNIDSRDKARVIQGNERVLRARLSDAAFFFETDQKETLASRVDRLKGMVFQAKLGTLYDKTVRISQLAKWLAAILKQAEAHAERAGMLSKADLTTNMVGEFPELQGVMGCYYAKHDNEPADVAIAMKEQYMPRFAGDELPANPIGQIIALADRLDTLVGIFGINQLPTGDKDPYGLRRATLGVLRILIENGIDLDLKTVLEKAKSLYPKELNFSDEVIPQLLMFIQERLRGYYLEQGVTPDVFSSVAALGITNPLDAQKRIKAVQAFKKLTAAETLSIANKRVSNILSKYADAIDAKAIDPAHFENAAEKDLAQQLEAKSKVVKQLYQSGQYDEVLLQLAELREPIDEFFNQVMVMTEDKAKRENRLLLLNQLRSLFLQVADIALLQ